MLAILHRDRHVGSALARLLGTPGDDADIRAVEDLGATASTVALPAGAVCIVDEGVARSPDDVAAFIRRSPGVRVVVITGSPLPQVRQYVEAGAIGIVDRDDASATIAPAVAAATAGLCAVPAPVLRDVLRDGPARAGARERPAPLSGLSPREYEIMEHLTAGRDAATIASSLGVSVSTVRSHVKSIFRKLGVHSSVEAVLFAISAGLRPDGPEAKPSSEEG